MFKKLNFKILVSSIFITLGLSYILPYREIEYFYVTTGIPFEWLTIYEIHGANSLFEMSNINPLALTSNIIIFYLLSVWLVSLKS